MSVETDTRLRAVIEAVRETPDDMVLPFLRALRRRRQDIATLLGGRPLRLEVVLMGATRRTYRIVFTPSGDVQLTGAYGFDPHIRFQGTPDRLLGVMLGRVDTFTAVYDQVLTLYFPPDELAHYARLRRLLAAHVEDCPAM